MSGSSVPSDHPPGTLIEVLRRRARAEGTRLACTFWDAGGTEGLRFTYGELDQRARAIARRLQEQDLAGERALLVYPPGLDYVAAFFGCLYAGVVAVPVYPPRPNRPMPRLLAILASAGAKVMLTTRQTLERMEKHLPTGLSAQPLTTDELSPDLAELWRDPGLGGEALAFLQYTSGSTAAPKGVMLSHANLLHNLELIRRSFALTREERLVSWLPPYHDMGLIGGILTPVYVGFPVTLMAPATFLHRPLAWLEAIHRERATVAGAPNFAYDLAVEKVPAEMRETLDLSCWQLAFNGAEPIRAATLERFAQAYAVSRFRPRAFYPCYGLAEGTLLVSGSRRGAGAVSRGFSSAALARHRASPAAGRDERILVGCGQSPAGQEIRIVDPATAVPCAPGQVGEIWVRGASVAQGYWGRAEETAATFQATLAGGEGPFLRTGDLGFLDGGELFVTGRDKDLIILRGRNHYPQDVEATVERCHPALLPGGAAAFAVEIDDEERLVVVQEVRRDARRSDPEPILEAIRRSVAEEHEVAVHAAVLIKPASLPKTSSGKVQRHACRNAFLDNTLAALAEWQGAPGEAAAEVEPAGPPRTAEELELWLAREIALRSGVAASRVDPHEPIASHALDSLQAMDLMQVIEARLGLPVAMDSFFEDVTPAELARQLLGERPAAAPALAAAAAEVGEHPLSQGQLSLWFLHLLDPRSPAYNVCSAVRLRGPLDAAVLRRACQRLVDRHPALRTTFTTVRGEPRQRVAEHCEVLFEVEDARGWSESALGEHLLGEANRPFDLAAGPLLRVSLFRRSVLESVLLVAMHHVVTDFWSLRVLLDELAVLYPALAAGEETELEPLPLAYSDFARWQGEMLASPEGERLRAWWGERLGGELPVLNLRTDRPRRHLPAPVGAVARSRLSRYLGEGLKEIGRRRRATPFMTLAALFQVLLYRRSGQRDLLYGTVTAGRTRAQLGHVLGYFVNPLVLRADLAGAPGFTTVLERTRRDVLGAFEHQDYPFPVLVEQLQPERDPGHSPLFDVLFVLQKAELADGQDLTGFALGEPNAAADVGTLRLEALPLEQGLAQFDLTLTVGEIDGAYVAVFDYDAQLFDAVTIEHLGEHFARLADGIVADPECEIDRLPLLTEAEERRLLEEWNDTRLAYPRDATLADLFETQAARTPDAPALLVGRERRTYLELNRRSSQIARHLQALGVGPETVVAICFERSIPLISFILGVLKAGGAYLPLDPEHPPERLAFTVRDAGAALVATSDKHQHLFAGGPPLVNLDRDIEAISGCSGENPARTASAWGLACVIYTSGSTGEPKGVELDHRSLVNMVASFLHSYRPGEDDRILPLTAIANASFVGEILPLLAAGGTLVLPESYELLDMDALLALMERRGVTIVSTVPAMMANLNALCGRLPRLRLLLVGGEALAAGDVDRLLGTVELVNGYGLTETAICSTCHRLEPADLEKGARLAIGKPVANAQVYVLDRRLRLLPASVPGEIFVAGDGLARAYRSDAAATAERFLPNPFGPDARMYRTGDLGAWRPDGNLEYLGRLDRQVELRGFRIELGEIESLLTLHPQVRKAVVTVREDLPGQPRLVGYVVPEGDPAPTAGKLTAYLHERLPGYMVPAALVFLGELPLRASGKVDVGRLPAPPERRRGGEAAPKSELERTVAGIWQEELGVGQVGLDDNFFDLGGHSLLMTRVHSRLKEALERELSLIELFRYPTVGSLARFLAGEEPAAAVETLPDRGVRRPAAGERDVAVIGLAGRFPGAANPDELWRNVAAGVDSIRFFSDEELLAAGVAAELVANPAYVKAKGILGDVDLFDAGFFGLNPREVELMDPQHRLFLECSWEALESAGYDAERYLGLVGVFGGESMNTYLLTNLLSHLELVASADTLQASLGNDKDPLTSRVAYKLNLKGPSVTVQTASSTSLAAVHVALRSLLEGDCDIALAGGVSIHLPEKTGYMYEEGGTTSKDGRTRAFDAGSTGFVSGHGAGVVVLKRLREAVADGDHIHAVIKGSACNNDGSAKVSFMAPSVDGQMAVYRRAYEDAGISPETVGYVECHGTGTAIGDPIEISALTGVFAAHTERRGFCAIGSLKTNIGHLDTAAGVCGLIKAILTLEHAVIPPSLHFEKPNPRIDFESSPFFVNTELRPWERSAGVPRRAGVTSLGMGGTNIHVVLEEAPAAPLPEPSRPWQLLLLSGRSAGALDAATERLGENLRRHGDLPLPDVAYTLQVGRKAFEHRRTVLARDRDDALAVLAGDDPERSRSAVHRPGDRPVAFLLTGQGAQYPNMGCGLYRAEPAFRDAIDLCARRLEPHLGFDLRTLLFVDAEDEALAAARLEQTEIAQPALFAVSYATARLWMSWGLAPRAMIGHSLGEYVAACLAGVMSLDDALAVVAMRGRLMQRMPPGAMASVSLAADEVAPLLGEELSLAAVNRASDCVVSGPADAVDELVAALAARGVGTRRLHTSHAFHSPMIEPMLRPFVDELRKVRLEPPRIPYLSNVTGTWIRAEEATDPEYWARHLRRTVRFADGVGVLLGEPRYVLLEVGPGNTLTSLAQQHPGRGGEHVFLSSIRHPKEAADDQAFLLQTLGRLWLAGGEVDWAGFYGGEKRRRVPLPTYPFERQRYWVDPLPETARHKGGRRPPGEWFYAPGWEQAPLPASPPPAPPSSWLLFTDRHGLGERLAERLRGAGQRVATAAAGDGFRQLGDGRYAMAAHRPEDYAELARRCRPDAVVHLWNVDPAAGDGEGVLERGFYSLLYLAQALGRGGEPAAVGVVARGLFDVTGSEELKPLKAALLGPCGVAPREHPHLSWRVVDVELPAAAGDDDLAARILRELAAAGGEPLVALRGRHRWRPSFTAVELAGGAAPRLRDRGVYLLTGGLGGLGLELAEYLAREHAARLVLVGRTPLPPREDWDERLAELADGDPLARKLRRLAELEELGAEVLPLAADVADREAMAAVKAAAERRFGAVHGVIHAAGVPGAGLIRTKEPAAAAAVLRPKVDGLRVLAELFGGERLDFLALFSSLTAVLPEIGQSDYVAANAVLDAWAAASRDGTPTVSINWDAWREAGMAVTTAVPEELKAWRQESLEKGLGSAEGVDAFRRILASGLPRVVVSTVDLELRRRQNADFRPMEALETAVAEGATHARPELSTDYVAPQGELERQVAAVWQEILGIEQIGVLDNFFELGGNSLAGIRITQRLKERLAADISDVSLYEGPTVRALARLMAAAGGGPEEAPPAQTAAAESRSRGERRRARLERRRGAE